MDAGYTLEAHCLGVLLRRPSLIYRVDRSLQAAGLVRLAPEDWLAQAWVVLSPYTAPICGPPA